MAFFQGNITPLVLRVKADRETCRQDTIPKLRHGNNRPKSRNVKPSQWSSAVVFNAKRLLQRLGGGEGGRSGGCVIKGEANRNASQPSGLIFYEMPLSPEDLLTLTVCPSARPRSQTRTFKIEELTEGVTFVACGFIS